VVGESLDMPGYDKIVNVLLDNDPRPVWLQTWGGLLGFMIGKSGVEDAFGREFSDRFNIHRTRRNFPNQGIDTFENMAKKGVFIIDLVV